MAIKMVLNQSMIDNVSLQNFYLQREKYNYSIELQRGLVWSEYQKSNLINSLLVNMPVPTLIVNKTKDGVLNFVDGVNRSNAIIDFIANKYPISDGIDDVEIVDVKGNSKLYTLVGKRFDDFEPELQNQLLTRIIKVEICDNLDEQTEAEILLRLNNGTPMTSTAKARVMAYKDIQPFITGLCKEEFFSRKVNITRSSKSKFNHEQILYIVLALELKIEDKISISNPEKIVEYIQENSLFTDEVKQEIKNVIEYMNQSFPVKHKFLTVSNIIPVYNLAKLCMKENIAPRRFLSIIDSFMDNNMEEFDLVKNGKWMMKSNIETKSQILIDYYNKINIHDENKTDNKD